MKLLLISIIPSLIIQSVLAILVYPIGALDIFNNIAQGRLFNFYHQNPYLVTFNSFPSDQLNRYAIFTNFPLAYGPAWLLSTSILDFFIPSNSSIFLLVISYKFFNLLLLFLVSYTISCFYSTRKERIVGFYILFANPFVLFETLTNGHNDILMTFFLVLAVFFLKKKILILASLFLSLSIAVKYFSVIVLIPIIASLVRLKLSINKFVLPISVFTGSLLFLYIPHFISGLSLYRLLVNLKLSQSTFTSSVYSLIREYLSFKNPKSESLLLIFLLSAVAMLVLVFFYVYRSKTYTFQTRLITVMVIFLVTVTSANPWYFIPILALLSSHYPQRNYFNFIHVLTLSLLVYYPLSVWAWFNSGFTPFHVHLFGSIFTLILPIIGVISINSRRCSHL